jgi:uncharacterized protein involved in type VI secretion and phage assembly
VSTAIGALTPNLKVEGSPLAANLLGELVSARVERGLGLVGRATLRFSDAGYSLSASDTFALGKQVSISVPDSGELLSGTVTGVNLEQSSNAHPELVVVIDDDAYKLTRGSQAIAYLNRSYTNVIEQIAGRHGLTAAIDATTDVHDYLLQAGSDIEFLNAVVERTGLCWYVDGQKLVVTKVEVGTPDVRLELGTALTEFSVRASGLRPTALTVSGWDPAQQTRVVGNAQQPASAPETPAFLADYVGAKPGGSLPAAESAIAEFPTNQGEANATATSLYGDWAAGAIVARGTSVVSSRIKPGATVGVENAGPASGNYLVSEVDHLYNRNGFFSRFTSGPRRPAGLVDTLGSQPPSPGFTIPGLTVALVTANDDPDGEGRVKVKYASVDDQVESPWARVVSLGAGAGRGVVFQPEVNDEVLVGFEHGDSRRPVVIGGLFSKANTLPTADKLVANGAIDYRRITSRKNHIVELADGGGPTEQHILLKLGTAEHKLRLGADRFDIEVASGKEVTIKAGQAKFDINSSGDVTIEGNNVTIKAKLAVKVEAGSQATLKGAQTAVQGTQVQVKADGVGSVEAGGPLTLKGAMVGIN